MLFRSHTVSLIERKNIQITGVKKIESFDENEFLIETVMGFIIVKGCGLELLKLDTYDGAVSIKGQINSFIYVDEAKNNKEDSFLGKLFK